MALNLMQRLVSSKPRRYAIIAAAGLATGTTLISLSQPAFAEGNVVHPNKFDWPHGFGFNGYDHASIRRGWEVYKNVCAACHGIKYIKYRHMVGVFLTEAEAKAEAADIMVEDGPDETGKMYMRPGILSDGPPNPYPNEEAARAANNGAYPPDLSLIVIAREGGEDYIFSLLTGYCEAPAGIHLDEGQYFNAYFLDGAIGMPQPLHDEMIEYSDGTPASQSQMAKDVTTFLAWCSMSELDERKLFGIKTLIIGIPTILACWYWKRHTWIGLKTRKITYVPKKEQPPK